MPSIKEYWSSLGELARSRGLGDLGRLGDLGEPGNLENFENIKEMLHREFPKGASELPEGFDRREFLKIMAASIALAGVTACTRQAQERIVPYIRQPEEIIPGIPLFYASALTIG